MADAVIAITGIVRVAGAGFLLCEFWPVLRCFARESLIALDLTGPPTIMGNVC
jgi:hypothetical protein